MDPAEKRVRTSFDGRTDDHAVFDFIGGHAALDLPTVDSRAVEQRFPQPISGEGGNRQNEECGKRQAEIFMGCISGWAVSQSDLRQHTLALAGGATNLQSAPHRHSLGKSAFKGKGK